ncbi:MAG: glycosyltransferase [Endozoicomonadaceae bacterium]|nr:glycosyltransferase [Endozoicomonadaceae bacterium]
MSENKVVNVLQFCHGYEMPFCDVAKQYASIFCEAAYHVVTVFLTGVKNSVVSAAVGGTVIFLENTSAQVRGLKLRQIMQLKRLHEQYQFIFAIAHRFKPLYIATHIKKLPVIGVHHAYGDYKRLRRRWYIYRHQKELFCLLGVSDAIRDDLRHCLPKIDKQRIQTFYNAVETDSLSTALLSKQAARKKLNLPDEAFVFANVGRLHPDKDQSTLIKAFSKVHLSLPNSVLVIVGTGRLEQQLKQEAIHLNIDKKVYFLGKIPQVARCFNAFDCFVLSSDHEPFGMVLLEAMIAGVPIICSNCGGAPEVVGETGELFDVGNAEHLADKMQKIYHLSCAEIQQLAGLMQARVQGNFSYQAMRKTFWQMPFIQKITG